MVTSWVSLGTPLWRFWAVLGLCWAVHHGYCYDLPSNSPPDVAKMSVISHFSAISSAMSDIMRHLPTHSLVPGVVPRCRAGLGVGDQRALLGGGPREEQGPPQDVLSNA